MKIPSILLIGCLIALGLYQGLKVANQGDHSRLESPLFDAAQLLELEPFGDWDPDRHFTQDLSLVFYFSELSCQTCTTRELQNVARWHQRFGDRMDFYLVVQGQDPVYLNNLRRLGRVNYPILLEEHLGQLGLPKTTIALFRKNTQKILAAYFPSPDEPHPKAMTQLEERLIRELGAPSRQGA